MQVQQQSPKAKQSIVPPTTDLARSFKTTTNLAHGLTKERTAIQNELQKIGQSKLDVTSALMLYSFVAKSLLEEMR